jgi:hypothetical protein
VNRVTVLALGLWAGFGLKLLWQSTIADSVVDDLRIPFASFPLEIDGLDWEVEEVPLLEEERRAAGLSAYIQRLYTKGDRELWLYVGFVGGGTAGAIHAPEYCLPAGGYELGEEETIHLDLPGIPQPTRWKENLWTDSTGAPVYSLYSFYYNGRFEPSEWRLRASRILGVPYFAVLNVTGDYTGTLAETRGHYAGILRSVVPLLLRHFP